MLVAAFDDATAGQLKTVKEGWVMKVYKEVVIPPTDMVVKWEAAVAMVGTEAAGDITLAIELLKARTRYYYYYYSIPLTPELGVCAYCPDKALDAHHAVTCKFGGDVVVRHNALRNAIFDFCKRALLNPKLETGAGLGHERRLTRPADILIPSWSNGDKPAAIDVSITSPLKSNILSEAGVVAGAAARQTEERKHTCNDTICSELGWKCVPLVVETFGAWGRTAGQFFGELASRLAAQSHSSKTTMLNNIYGRLSLILFLANARAFNARLATTMDLLEG
ncbi:hypothetical protein EMCRGX_G013584 [Ephydatia muelleri]